MQAVGNLILGIILQTSCGELGKLLLEPAERSIRSKFYAMSAAF